MTEQEYRALEIDVAKAMGYQVKPYNIKQTLWTVVAPNGAYWMRPCDMRPTEERVWQEAMPRFITDPAATAEVVQYLHRRGWCYELRSNIPIYPGEVVLWVLDSKRQDGKLKTLGTANERFADHEGDPVRAWAVALCRAVIAAVAAIEATKTKTSDQERKGNADATSHP